jgi:aspartyl/asparaginyl beta-hydroxylase (cupin superfamily)
MPQQLSSSFPAQRVFALLTATAVMLMVFLLIIIFWTICYCKWLTRYPDFMIDERFANRTLLCAVNGFVSYILEAKEANTPFLDVRQYPICKKLEESFPDILHEVQSYVRKNSLDSAPEYGSVDGRNEQLSFHDGKEWKILVFKYYREYNKTTCSDFPKTCSLLQSMPEVNLAMLSIMEGGKKLTPHQGPFKGIARIHLAIEIPSPVAVLTVDGIEYEWEPGKCVVFDDTFVHSVHNKSNSYRIVLFIDVMRPELPQWVQKIFTHPTVSEYFGSVNQKIEKHAAQNTAQNAAAPRD